MSAPIHADFRRHPHPSMRTSAPIHADVRTNPCGRPHGHPQRCPQMSALMSADVRRLPRTSLRTTADLHMEILWTSAQKKFPACVDLRTKRPNTPQTSAGKCPQFSMRHIAFFADISGTGSVRNAPKSVDFHETYECNNSTFTTTCRISIPIPRRLANKRSDTQLTYLSHKIHDSNGTESGLHTKSKEVRFDTNTTILIYRYGISNLSENSQSSSGSSESSYSD